MMTTGPTNDATGTFRAAGCHRLQPGTARAYGDRIPVPNGVEGPRPRKIVPDDVARPTPPTTKTYKYYRFVKPFNIRELSRSPVVPLGLARDSGRMNTSRRILALALLMLVPVALALAAEFMAVVPGPPAQPSPVYLTSAGDGS